MSVLIYNHFNGTFMSVFIYIQFNCTSMSVFICSQFNCTSMYVFICVQFNGYGGGYADDLENLALAVACKPFTDHVEVKLFDQSRGKGNSFEGAYVQVKVCSFAAQAHGPPIY